MHLFQNPSTYLSWAADQACLNAASLRREFITPECLLYEISLQQQFIKLTGNTLVNQTLSEYLKCYSCTIPFANFSQEPETSVQFDLMREYAYQIMEASQAKELDVPHVIAAMLKLEDSYAHDLLLALCDGDEGDLLSKLLDNYSDAETKKYIEENLDSYDDDIFGLETEWEDYVTCINDLVKEHNPLIGRKQELDRTMLVLCRKDKNNPVHVGEAGVGKTALAYGLAALIENGKVPQRLQGCRIYELDLASLLAGTQYRGDFEKRLKTVLKGVTKCGNAILYLDEIHNIVGAGRVEGSMLDASNILKPYLEQGSLRFMGATTYEEYKHVVKSKAFSRRFEKIDIPEPSIDECKTILHGLCDKYATFHGVEYDNEAIDFAVEAAAKYINGRFLPDKAIDLIDEAGAWLQTHHNAETTPVVTKKLISEVLAKICNVETLAQESTDIETLGQLQQRLLSQIYGQDKAVTTTAQAVEMSIAGLTDDNKPTACLLFVGPTGVGKTELARVLAKELALPLIRFDMSEYAEKHTVAKLIGAPAGYVGYDDGGLLTDAVRKQPHSVVLLDEIEKAHADIWNILLQVMDYASLTDNKGQKADFRHVVLIMTTNAGAQNASMGGVGFNRNSNRGDSMLKSVKQTFKPEFLNRLSDIAIFNDLDQHMAALIIDKKLSQLQQKLTEKNVSMELDPSARALLLREGFSAEYGGREIERVINNKLKPVLMRAMLYGSLRNGGIAHVAADGDNLIVS